MASLKQILHDADIDVIIDVFETHYPAGHMRPISLDKIPPAAMNKFEGYSCRFIPSHSYVERNFDKSFIITTGDAMKTYVVTQDKKYPSDQFGDKRNIEKQAYFVAMNADDRILYSEIRFNITDSRNYFKDKPFVGFSGCENNAYYDDDVLQKIWVMQGADQIVLMNALSHALFNLPIHSDTTICSHEKPLWNLLLNQGHIQSYLERENNSDKGLLRYVFKSVPRLYKHNEN